jgi:hypothetical protein
VRHHLKREQVNIMCDLCIRAACACACLAGVEDVVGFIEQLEP